MYATDILYTSKELYWYSYFLIKMFHLNMSALFHHSYFQESSKQVLYVRTQKLSGRTQVSFFGQVHYFESVEYLGLFSFQLRELLLPLNLYFTNLTTIQITLFISLNEVGTLKSRWWFTNRSCNYFLAKGCQARRG